MFFLVIHQLFLRSFSFRLELPAARSILFGSTVHLIDRLHKAEEQAGMNVTFFVAVWHANYSFFGTERLRIARNGSESNSGRSEKDAAKLSMSFAVFIQIGPVCFAGWRM